MRYKMPHFNYTRGLVIKPFVTPQSSNLHDLTIYGIYPPSALPFSEMLLPRNSVFEPHKVSNLIRTLLKSNN